MTDLTDFYASDYQTAGPNARPYIRRSAYLARALQAMQQDANRISSTPELGVRLLAAALTQYGQSRNERRLREAETQDRANDPLVTALRGLLPSDAPAPQPQAAAPSFPGLPPATASGMAPNAQALAQALSNRPSSPPAPQAMGAGSGVGAPRPDFRAMKTEDALTRLAFLESPTPEGQQAVVNTALNRAASSGMDLADVITQRGQFEPFGNRETWERGLAVPVTDPRYQQAAQAVQAARQQDITGGATHFWGPETQRAMGRPPPAWARPGQGTTIGGNEFFRLPFQAPRGYQPPQPPQQAAPVPGSETMSTNGFPVPPPPPPPNESPGPPAGGAPPAAPQAAPPPPAAGGQPGAIANGRVTPEQIRMAMALIQDPRTNQQGRAMAMQILQRASAPVENNVRITDQGQQILTNPYTGEMQVAEVPGFRQSPVTVNGVPVRYSDGPQGPTGTALPVPPQAMSQTSTPAGFVPGTQVSTSPTGQQTVLQAPPANYAYVDGRMVPIGGGAADPRSATNRLEGLRGIRQEIAPVLNAATNLVRNISAVRTGFQQQNGPGDIAMVNGLQKLIDEGVVREGDVNLQLQAQGLQGGLAGLVAFLQSTGRFDGRIRSQLLATANALYGQMEPTYRDRILGYRGITERAYGAGAFEDVVPSATLRAFGWGDEPQRQPQRPQQGHGAPRPQQRPQAPRIRLMEVR